MRRDWTESTVVVLTCDRDAELMDLCRAGVKKFWPGIRIAEVHDKNTPCLAPDVPGDLWELSKTIPYLRKVLDMPWASETDQIYCIDSDCLIVDEPWDWPAAAYLSVAPGCLGSMWLRWGSAIWESLGCPPIDTTRIFCGGCWSARRSEMFEPYRDLTFAYIRECHKRHKDHKFPGPVYEQCLLNGLWHMAYKDRRLPEWRYPLYHARGSMAILHLSEMRNTPGGEAMIEKYKAAVGLTIQPKETQDERSTRTVP